jgi:hypothetical protein
MFIVNDQVLDANGQQLEGFEVAESKPDTKKPENGGGGLKVIESKPDTKKPENGKAD